MSFLRGNDEETVSACSPSFSKQKQDDLTPQEEDDESTITTYTVPFFVFGRKEESSKQTMAAIRIAQEQRVGGTTGWRIWGAALKCVLILEQYGHLLVSLAKMGHGIHGTSSSQEQRSAQSLELFPASVFPAISRPVCVVDLSGGTGIVGIAAAAMSLSRVTILTEVESMLFLPLENLRRNLKEGSLLRSRRERVTEVHRIGEENDHLLSLEGDIEQDNKDDKRKIEALSSRNITSRGVRYCIQNLEDTEVPRRFISCKSHWWGGEIQKRKNLWDDQWFEEESCEEHGGEIEGVEEHIVVLSDLLFIAIRDDLVDVLFQEIKLLLTDNTSSNQKRVVLLFVYEERIVDQEALFLERLRAEGDVLLYEIDVSQLDESSLEKQHKGDGEVDDDDDGALGFMGDMLRDVDVDIRGFWITRRREGDT